MDFEKFCKAIKKTFEDQNDLDNLFIQSEICQFFLSQLNPLATSNSENDCLSMTRLTVLFEGFYLHLTDSVFKKKLSEVKGQRWERHFGTPTVVFLLSYKTQIDKTKQYFDTFSPTDSITSIAPWLVDKQQDHVIDNENDLLIDPKSVSRITLPNSKEVMGIFYKTHNPHGGFTTAPCDPISQEFIKHAALSAKRGGRVLEIGAAFGAATLEAIAKGATVFCNDIEPENLAVVRQRFIETSRDEIESVTGDSNKLVLIPGELPNELNAMPENFFDAILICRVMHFFTGKKIEESLDLLSKLLAPEGKIYIVCETPFLKNWQSFIPEFNRRIAENIEWPGEITNPADYESSGRAASLPKFVHWITKEVLERCLVRSKLAIEKSTYINRLGQFPDDLLLPEHGKESVGAIGVKRS